MNEFARPPESESVRRKGTLFCPACAYESPIDERWVETTTATVRVRSCPECGAVVDSRPRRRPLASAGVG
ncbi:hypothetical protein [Halorarum halobium]|uniref:hypothetical protein n=1 Tax=Halorarum halobium TaxID=3075121 RepID=UPI0028A7FBEF|nr:hypothetical protein [Halobaculum sp. XH14]